MILTVAFDNKFDQIDEADYWLARNETNVPEWGDTPICELLFQ
jgi:hypothetical protein